MKEKKTQTQENLVTKFEEHFNHEDVLIILEAAKQAFENKDMFTIISEKLDITDDHLYDLRYELQKFMNEE